MCVCLCESMCMCLYMCLSVCVWSEALNLWQGSYLSLTVLLWWAPVVSQAHWISIFPAPVLGALLTWRMRTVIRKLIRNANISTTIPTLQAFCVLEHSGKGGFLLKHFIERKEKVFSEVSLKFHRCNNRILHQCRRKSSIGSVITFKVSYNTILLFTCWRGGQDIMFPWFCLPRVLQSLTFLNLAVKVNLSRMPAFLFRRSRSLLSWW